MLQKVHDYQGYTKKEVETAILACKVQAKMGHHTDAKFKLPVGQKLLGIAL